MFQRSSLLILNCISSIMPSIVTSRLGEDSEAVLLPCLGTSILEMPKRVNRILGRISAFAQKKRNDTRSSSYLKFHHFHIAPDLWLAHHNSVRVVLGQKATHTYREKQSFTSPWRLDSLKWFGSSYWLILLRRSRSLSSSGSIEAIASCSSTAFDLTANLEKLPQRNP